MNKIQDLLLYSHDRVRNNYSYDAIEMYNIFMDHMLPYIVREFSKIDVTAANTGQRHVVQFGNVTVHKPLIVENSLNNKTIKTFTKDELYPQEARTRGLTYSCHVVVDIDYNILDADGNPVIGPDGKESRISYREVPLLSIPVMLRSKYCHLSNLRNLEALKECEYDEGGYFIIRGNPKVIVSQKTMRINVDIARRNDDRIDAEIRSLRADEKFRSTSTLYIHYVGNPPTFRIDIPFLASGMPMVAIFRALGFNTQEEIEDFLWDLPDDPRKKLVATMYKEPVMHMTIDEVYTELGHGMYNEHDLTPEKVRKQVQQQINGELLPHVGFDDEPETKFKKAIYLRSIMLHMLDIYTGTIDPDDRDFEGFKSIQMSASILSTMFRQMFSAFVKTIRNKMYDRFQKNKHLDIAAFIAHSDTLTRDVLKAFSEGEVTVKQISNAGTGVIQIVHQVNPLGLSTHVQRVSTQLPKDGKYPNMRGTHTTSLFTYCPAETPEGECAGLLQNLTIFAKVRIGSSTSFLVSTLLKTFPKYANDQGYLEELVEPLKTRDQLRSATLVLVNSDPVAITTCPGALLNLLRQARRDHVFPIDTSILYTSRGIRIFGDMGVVVFPLIHLETFRKKWSIIEKLPGEIFTNCINAGLIEYIDAWELLEYRVAFQASEIEEHARMPHTHLAMHPTALLGVCASTVPWSDHDQAPRVSYQAGMVKQAIGTPATNLDDRMDMNYAFQLWYPQAPIADTIISRSRGLHDWPMGENKLIAIASYTGLSQEDAIIVNQGTIDRGSGRVFIHRMFKCIVRKIGSDYEAFENALDTTKGPCVGLRGESNYSKIDHHGLPFEKVYYKNGDIIIGRVLYTTDENGLPIRRDRSIVLTCEESEDYIMDKIVYTTNRDGYPQIRVRLRSTRVPQHGDKLSDRHGQKGVIGALLPEEDMPFVASGPNEGLRPDLIVNLHSINGRMTIGKLLEMLYSALGLVHGSLIDATPFRDVNARWAIQELINSGYGDEVTMINGMNGKVMEQPWFIGSCFYQSLKHMVQDKVHARARGPRAALTRQPLDGRANQGGQRFGEMEKDAILASGAAYTLDDRSRIASDGHTTVVCTNPECGQVGESKTSFTLEGLLNSGNIEKNVGCRICGSPVTVMKSLYCWSGLLLKEQATLGIKMAHEVNTEDTVSNIFQNMNI